MQPTNLIVLLARQLDWSMPGENGNCLSDTCAIDALGEESVRITNAVSGEPEPAAARRALLSGRYRAGRMAAPEKSPFARALCGAGYAVSFAGGWNRTAHAPQSPDAETEEILLRLEALSRAGAPFALFCDFDAPGDGSGPALVRGEDLSPFEKKWFRPSPSFCLGDRRVPESVRLTTQVLEEENRRRQRRYAMLTALDRSVGRILDRVEELAISRDTLILFTSDGGLLFGDHGRVGGNIYYEEAVRVPLYLRKTMTLAPGEAPLCLSTADVMPTVLSLLGIPLPETVSGHDFAPALLEGREDNAPALLRGPRWAALRTGTHALCRDLPAGTLRLFDLRTDPYELNDLARDPACDELRQALERQLEERLSALPQRKRKNTSVREDGREKEDAP